MSQSQKEECKEHKSEKRQSRPQKRPQTSSRCLRLSPSASNKHIKISQTSVTSQKAGLCPVNLDDFFRARRSHTPSGRGKKKCNKWKMSSKPRKKDRKKKHKAKANAKHEEQRKQKEVTSSDKNHEIETEQAQDTPENQVNKMPETEGENINTEKEPAQDVHEEQPERQEQPVDVLHCTDEAEHQENAADVVPHGTDKAESGEKAVDVPHGADEAEREEKAADVPYGADQAESQEKASDVSDSNECKTKLENLLEPDPNLKAFEKVHTVEEAVALLEVSDDEKPRKSIAVETKIETSDGVMNVKLIGLKAPNKKDRKFTCPREGCQEFRPTQGELNSHLQKIHKATFPCSKCEKKYETANGLNKHFKKHFKFTNICRVCNKGFQFLKQMKTHKGIHREDNVGKYPCLTRDCKKVLLSKQGLEAHQKIHEEKEYICNDCQKSFSSDLHLKQHISGKHGEGSLSFCGQHFQWPDSKYRHQRICDECK